MVQSMSRAVPLSNYNAEVPHGPRNYMNLLVRRSRMEGFVVFDYFELNDKVYRDIVTKFQSGRV